MELSYLSPLSLFLSLQKPLCVLSLSLSLSLAHLDLFFRLPKTVPFAAIERDRFRCARRQSTVATWQKQYLHGVKELMEFEHVAEALSNKSSNKGRVACLTQQGVFFLFFRRNFAKWRFVFSNWQNISFFLLGQGGGGWRRFSRQISKNKCLENIKFTTFYPMFELSKQPKIYRKDAKSFFFTFIFFLSPNLAKFVLWMIATLITSQN